MARVGRDALFEFNVLPSKTGVELRGKPLDPNLASLATKICDDVASYSTATSYHTDFSSTKHAGGIEKIIKRLMKERKKKATLFVETRYEVVMLLALEAQGRAVFSDFGDFELRTALEVLAHLDTTLVRNVLNYLK